MPTRNDTILSLLREAASHVVPCPDGDPSTSGWMNAENRRTPLASILTNSGPMTIASPGLEAYERAVTLLAKEPAIRNAWDLNELWSVVASLVISSSGKTDLELRIVNWLEHVRKASGGIVAFVVGNVEWAGERFEFADGLIGLLDKDFQAELSVNAAKQHLAPIAENWCSEVRQRYEGLLPTVAFATSTKEKGSRSIGSAFGKFRILIDLTLLFMQGTLHELCRQCARVNRPGVRGLALDRRSVELKLGGKTSGELDADIVYLSSPRFGRETHWHNAEPFPLAEILRAPGVGALVAAYLVKEGPVADRVRIAARWYSESHWAEELQDSALALGIALDALVGSPSGLPLRALSERFALLEELPRQRTLKARRFRELYGIRSAVAHGARSTSLNSATLTGMADEVFWAAGRLDELDRRFTPKTERQLEEVFEGLRWGTHGWSD